MAHQTFRCFWGNLTRDKGLHRVPKTQTSKTGKAHKTSCHKVRKNQTSSLFLLVLASSWVLLRSWEASRASGPEPGCRGGSDGCLYPSAGWGVPSGCESRGY